MCVRGVGGGARGRRDGVVRSMFLLSWSKGRICPGLNLIVARLVEGTMLSGPRSHQAGRRDAFVRSNMGSAVLIVITMLSGPRSR